MLHNKVVVITGGAGLLGRAFCHEVALRGGVAVVADRDEQAAAEVAAQIQLTHPGQAIAATLDITDVVSINELVTRLHDSHGRIDALVNNAYPRNANYGRKVEDVVYADFCENLGLHLGGYFLTAQRFALYFRAQGSGNIINMSSIYGSVAPRFAVYEGTEMTMPVEYAAIKSGVLHLTRYFAQYFKTHGVRVNSLSPGGIFDHQPAPFLAKYNAMSGSKGMLDATDLLDAFVFLLSDGSRYMTGQDLIIDDGFTL